VCVYVCLCVRARIRVRVPVPVCVRIWSGGVEGKGVIAGGSCELLLLVCVVYYSVLQCVAGCCDAVQRGALWCSTLQCVAVRCSVLQSFALRLQQSACEGCGVCVYIGLCVTVRCSALQCIATCCSALQCVALCCSAPRAELHDTASRHVYTSLS